ncbi:MAG TPA: hypothetical protein VGO93_19180 [Candidatus Xenobia bacterium]|jgi:HSP20 family molecular chaperone IbpA
MFNDLFDGFGMRKFHLPSALWSSSLDFYRKGNDVIVECAVPGMKKCKPARLLTMIRADR